MTTLTEKFELFDEAHIRAKKTIEDLVAPGEAYEQDYVALANWIVTTDINPYGWMDERWAGSTFTAEGVANLLSNLHHAMVDDGDVSFVSEVGRNGTKAFTMIFKDQWDLAEEFKKSGAKVEFFTRGQCMEWVAALEQEENDWKERCEKMDKRRKEYLNSLESK
jgi:hypothetical protein